MEYVEGETLAQILTKLKETPSESETVFGKKDHVAYFMKIAEAFADVAEGLQHAHSKRVVHRDIKPSNLIRDTRDACASSTSGSLASRVRKASLLQVTSSARHST